MEILLTDLVLWQGLMGLAGITCSGLLWAGVMRNI